MKLSRRTALLTAASAAVAPPALAQKSADTLRIQFVDAVPNVDMYFNSQRTGLILAHQAWDMLVHRDPATFEIKPSLATDWRFAEDNSLDLTIRQGVKFHDGSTLIARRRRLHHQHGGQSREQGGDAVELCLDRQGREDRRLDRAHPHEAADAGGAGISRHGDADPSQGLSREGRARGIRQPSRSAPVPTRSSRTSRARKSSSSASRITGRARPRASPRSRRCMCASCPTSPPR